MQSDFIARCDAYLERLRGARNFDEILKLWRENNLPYTLPALDPFSAAYRDNVLAVYQQLTRGGYETQNELTSTKQSAESFRIGYPWVSKNLEVVAQELSKTVQAMHVLGARGASVQSIIEFGSGWGNLVLPLVKSGRRVTAVDIDPGFLQRTKDLVVRDGLEVETICGDFVEVAGRMEQNFDAAIFQSSFHHCLEFDELVARLGRNVLTAKGCVYFFSEPIAKNFAFPWGLRFDGESLWAIMCNKWLELGFDESFFLALMHRHGFMMTRVAGVPGYVGEGWIGTRAGVGIDVVDWVLPDLHEAGFWPRQTDPAHGRFLRGRATLPRLIAPGTGSYCLLFRNFGPRPLKLTLRGDAQQDAVFLVAAGGELEIDAPRTTNTDLLLRCDTFIPHRLIKNGDEREIGVALVRAKAVAG